MICSIDVKKRYKMSIIYSQSPRGPPHMFEVLFTILS